MPHPPSAQGPLWKSRWKNGKRGRLKRTKTKQHLRDTAGLTNSEQLRLPAQDEASQHSGMARQGAREPPPSDEELLRADGGIVGGEPFFFEGVAPGRSTMLQWMAHIDEFMDSTDWIWWVILEEK